MGISGISGSAYSQAVDSNELFKNWANKKLRASGDCLSISDEGREKAEELAKAKKEAELGLPGVEGMDEAAAGGGTDSSPTLVGVSTADRIKGLERRIKALTDQLNSLPPKEKMLQEKSIQERISEFQAQLDELIIQVQQENSA